MECNLVMSTTYEISSEEDTCDNEMLVGSDGSDQESVEEQEYGDILMRIKALEAQSTSKFKCTDCPNIYASQQALNVHKVVHKRGKVQSCICVKSRQSGSVKPTRKSKYNFSPFLEGKFDLIIIIC